MPRTTLHPNFPDDADLITKVVLPGPEARAAMMPTPNGLADAPRPQLGLGFKNTAGANGEGGNPAFALLAHSSALTARKVTTLTPTVVRLHSASGRRFAPHRAAYVFLAFDPGEQFVEVAANDPTVSAVNFYVVFFDQACKTAAGGCTNADLLHFRSLLTGWSNVRVYEMSHVARRHYFRLPCLPQDRTTAGRLVPPDAGDRSRLSPTG